MCKDKRNGTPSGTLVLNGLFDVKSLEAGNSKYLYLNTYPEEGVKIRAVSSSDEAVVRAGCGNNSAGMTTDDVSGRNSNYNYVKLDAVGAGEAEITVTAEDTAGSLGSVVKSFQVQVTAPRYADTRRTVTDISEGWKFCLERDMETPPADGTVPLADEKWETVTIPHCWNAVDGADGGDDYHKGTAWYIKRFSAEELAPYDGRQLYLEIGAACKISEIYVDGCRAARHESGYSRVRVDLTDKLNRGCENTIAIRVDNRVNDVIPLSGDFTVFGGLYREIHLIAVGGVHMDLDQETSFGGRGLYVSQRGAENVHRETTVEEVFGQGGRLLVRGMVKNSAAEAKKVSAAAAVYDAEWNKAAEYLFDLTEIPAGERHCFEKTLVVEHPHLWNGMADPYQYNVVFEIRDADGSVADRERTRIGFRFFCADPEKGFFLNGKSYPLRGVSTHQDRFRKGNAALHQDREQDMALIAELGANAIRFAHYQHDPFVYELASERGITAWAEIPMVTASQNTWDFVENVLNTQNQLIYQCFNEPAIIVWGNHNEQWPNNKGINVLLDMLYKNVKKLDPSRLAAVATAQPPADTAVDDQMGIALNWQSDVSGWNKYFGLYQGRDARYFGAWVNDVHRYGIRRKTVYGTGEGVTDPDGKRHEIPVHVHGNVGMAEYGVEGNPYVHDENPGYWDDMNNRSEEWQSQWHEIHYKAIAGAEWMWGSYVWNMFEFGSDGRPDPGRQGTNNKGMVSYDRTIKKDVYYFYKANWSKEPTLYITGKRFCQRSRRDIRVKVYSNMEEVELFVDGKSQGTLISGAGTAPEINIEGRPDETLLPNTQLGKFVWEICVKKEGVHEITAVGRKDGKTYVDIRRWNWDFAEGVDGSSKGMGAVRALTQENRSADAAWDQPYSWKKPLENTKGLPAAVSIALTNPKSTEEYFYLTGVRIHFSEDEKGSFYGYNIFANNIVGIPTGFTVDAGENRTPGWIEHWTEDGASQIKDLTLNIQKCSNSEADVSAPVQELQIYAWRIQGSAFFVDEISKTIQMNGKQAAADELYRDLAVMGSCSVKLVDADGRECSGTDVVTDSVKLLVTDVKRHVFCYQVKIK